MDSISIAGAKILFKIGNIPITETQVNSVLALLAIWAICAFLTHGISVRPTTKRQLAAEWIVEKVTNLVRENMGEKWLSWSPFIAAIMGLSAVSSLSSLLGFYPPTADLNTVLGWAVLVFVMITYFKIKTGGIGGYLKGFTEPIVVFTPFNILGEFATPVSMAFRHFGNVVSGVVISTLVYTALAGVSTLLLGWLPGYLGQFPLFQIGIPAVLSVYFDLFSSCMQAFIFAMLTMLYIAAAADTGEE